jgi:DNA polymerase-3 subunit chi
MITFLRVRNNLEKIQMICDLSKRCFFEKQRVMIRAANEVAAKYIDDLLWKVPKEGFLPHELSETPIDEVVTITTKEENLNRATVLINLSHSYPKPTEYQEIFELLDETTEEKKQASLLRVEAYKKLGFTLNSVA